ncbi:MAG: DinB family protein [Bryobacteraceae bacterium]|jgi:uncharacterized damage-inducible protein DinB
MLDLLQDLVRHKGYANAALLRSVRGHEKAAEDKELRELLHHVILANRFWLSLILGRVFVLEVESRTPDSIGDVAAQYKETHAQELEWISKLHEPDLDRRLETPFLPGRTFSVAQAVTQVCMHSHGHRAQCAAMLRQLGVTPPATDFIAWLAERREAEWS